MLAWYFVVIWGSGFIATKIGIQYAAPFTFLSLRFAFGLACLIPLVFWLKPSWPKTQREWLHIIIAGLLMHAIHLSGSHYAQYLGMSAGIAAVILALQPLATALIARSSGDRVTRLHMGRALVPADGTRHPVPRRERQQDEDKTSHRTYLLATGAQSSEKLGLSSSARVNQRRAAGGRPRQRSIIPRWKNLSASRVPSRSARRE